MPILEHRTKGGILFTADDRDLKSGVQVHMPTGLYIGSGSAGIFDVVEIMCPAVAEFIGWHALCIHPALNGFQGYDCVTFVFVEEKDDTEG